MWRLLLLWISIIAITLLEFEFLPGHSYLRSDTQIFVPMLERLAAPAFLSRDFVASSPHLTFTAYDELTLLLQRAFHQNVETLLGLQQFICRAAAVGGVFGIASSTGLKDSAALVVAAIVNAGAALPGAPVFVTEPEAVPHGLSFSLCLFAFGMLVQGKPLISGLAGGIALLYHPLMAAVFWIAVLAAFVFDRNLRKLVRPMLTVLLVSALLLANLAQLQPGVVEMQSFFRRVSPPWMDVLRERTPEALLSEWPTRYWLLYLSIFAMGLVAGFRIRALLNRQCKWIGSFLLLAGALSLPLGALVFAMFHWSLVVQIQPARALAFTVALASTAAGVAGFYALRQKKRVEAGLWCVFVIALALAGRTDVMHANDDHGSPVKQLSAWAERNTWGGSMFLFPDAGRELYPGTFRAQSIRAVYVDWAGGSLAKYFEPFALEWKSRWDFTMRGAYSPARLERTLSLPIDYYVLRREHSIARVQPAFVTDQFVVYEADALRRAPTPLVGRTN